MYIKGAYHEKLLLLTVCGLVGVSANAYTTVNLNTSSYSCNGVKSLTIQPNLQFRVIARTIKLNIVRMILAMMIVLAQIICSRIFQW